MASLKAVYNNWQKLDYPRVNARSSRRFRLPYDRLAHDLDDLHRLYANQLKRQKS